MSSAPTGGVPARRAVIRWALRLFHREWRQQALVLAMLTTSVAASIGFASAAYNTVGVSDSAIFGSATYRYEADAPAASELASFLSAAEAELGVDVFVQWSRPIPGSVETVEYRAQDPQGAHSAPMLALRVGRYPSSASEIAVTDGLADTFALEIGDTFDGDGRVRTVVGLVENPSDLNAEFALAAPTDHALGERITLLGGGTATEDELSAIEDFGAAHLSGDREIATRDDVNASVAAAAGVLGTATIALVLVSLIAAAGFVVVAQRRMRQLGMLGAIGATEAHLRLVMVANGAVLGAVAAVIGAAVGLAGWIVAVPRLERAVGRRVDAWNVPWWVIGPAMALAIVAATAAAWWPARAIARVPITSALSGRPPRPRPAHRSAALAGIMISVGIVCLVLADGTRPLFLTVGTGSSVAGVLLVSPIAIQAVARAVRSLPLAVRLPLRDLARHQARSGTALAAISLTLGVPIAIVVTATAAESTRALGNLSDRQLLIWTRDASQPEGVSPYYTEDPNDEGFSPYLPRLSPAELDDLDDEVNGIAATIGNATVTGLDLATDPAAGSTADGRLAVTLARPGDNAMFDVAPLFVATPELLEHYGVDLAAMGTDTEVLAVPTDERLPAELRRMLVSDDLFVSNASGPPEPMWAVQPLAPGYTSLPGAFMTPDAVRERGWQSVRVGWLVDSASPITGEQRRVVRELAADAGMLVESRRAEPDLTNLRWVATAVGALVALGVLAMTIGLVRIEAASEVRTLTAAGATSGIRRTLSASTAGGLAMLGAALGTAGAYLALVAGYIGDIGALASVPVFNLAVIVLGIPAVAAAAGWLLAGREPPVLARQVME